MLAAAVLVTLVGAIAALRLEADADTSQLVDSDSETFAATEEFKREFGDDAVVVLVKGDLQRLVLTDRLGTMLALEGCLSGNVAQPDPAAPGREAEEAGGTSVDSVPAPCAELAETKPARVVYGPGTFLNQFAIQAQRLLGAQSQATIVQAREAFRAAAREARRQGASEAEQRQVGEAAAQQVLGAFQQQVLQLALRYGQTGLPRLDDPTFVSSVVFDSRSPGQPKARFSYLFPSADAALISVRLQPDLSESERGEAIDLIREAVADPAFAIRKSDYVVSGVPVVVDGLAEELSSEIFVLLGVALGVMALTLMLVFGPPVRLLPLVVALGAASVTFGILAAVGGSLTMGSLAVMPILIGLSVDYAIQFQARFGEARRAGSSAPRAAVEAAARGGPVIATAVLATGAGFLVLLLSPIPMIRGFGLLLVLGIAVAFAIALTVGLSALSLVRAAPSSAAGGSQLAGRRGGRALAGARSARARAGARIGAAGRRTLAAAVAFPGRVLALALIVAIAGWAAGTRTDVISDIRELVPSDLPELRNVDELQDATGVSGEVDVTVTAPDLTEPEVVSWMADFKRRVLERAGFEGEPSSCLDDQVRLCPSITLPDLFGDDTSPSRKRVRDTLGLLPPYFLQALVSRADGGRIGDTAAIPFGIKVMPFDEQKELIDGIRGEIDPPGTESDPPAGVSAEVVGLPVLAADANSALADNRYLLTGAGLAAVALALLLAYRSLRRALVPLIPIVLATGWSALGLVILGVPLNPMSATLGALVIAIATEFSVLLSARFEEERRGRELAVGEALRRAYARTGAAVAASGITAIAGFAALIATDIRMLRDFGLVTVLDLSVALVGVLVVLPAALVWAESGFAGLPRRLGRRRRAEAEAASG